MKKYDSKKIPSEEIFLTLSPEEQEAVVALDSIQEYKKGHVLVREGSYLAESYYVLSGVVRQYRIIEGQDITSAFYTEKQSVFCVSSSSNRQPSKFNLECIVDTKMTVVSFEKEKEMYARFPRFEKMCRIKTEKDLLEFQDKFSTFIASTPEERYKHLLDERPGLLERVPQYHLASYLGVKPESLSRIRKRLAKK